MRSQSFRMSQIDHLDDDDDEMLQQAIRMSRLEAEAKQDAIACTDRSSSMDEASNAHDAASAASGGSGGSAGASGRLYTVAQVVAALDDQNGGQHLSLALQRRVRDFKFAQQKRRERQGREKPWGILGLYAHLADIRADIEWAEDAAWRRRNGEPYLSWNDFDQTAIKGCTIDPGLPISLYSSVQLC
jgi:hypothetical protein